MNFLQYPNWAGEWNNNCIYQYNDLVNVFTTMYLSLIDNNTSPVTNTRCWYKIQRRTPTRRRINNNLPRRNIARTRPSDNSVSTLMSMLGFDLFHNNNSGNNGNNDNNSGNSNNDNINNIDSDMKTNSPDIIDISVEFIHNNDDIGTNNNLISNTLTQTIFNSMFNPSNNSLLSLSNSLFDPLYNSILQRSAQEQKETLHPVLPSELERLPKIIYNNNNKNNVVCSICQSGLDDEIEEDNNNSNSNNNTTDVENKQEEIKQETEVKQEKEIKEEYTLIQLPCFHEFHLNCITPWFKKQNSCPVCRYPLLTIDQTYNETVVKTKQLEYESKIKEYKQKKRMETCVNLAFLPESEKDCTLLSEDTSKIILPTCKHIYHKECLQSSITINHLPNINFNSDQEQTIICPYCKQTSIMKI